MPYYARPPREFSIFTQNAHCTDLIVKYKWLPNSPDFNHLVTNVCGAMLQTFYKLNLKTKTIFELKVLCRRYGITRRRLSQYHLNACVLAGGKHFEHQICTFSKNILSNMLSCFCSCNIPAIYAL